MPKHRRRDTGKGRTYEGAEKVETLLTWLDSTDDESARSRMHDIVVLSLHLSVLGQHLEFSKENEEDLEQQELLLEKIEALGSQRNDLLAYYQLIPSYLLIEDKWRLFWMPAPRSDWRIFSGRGKKVVRGSKGIIGEQDAFFALIELLRSGGIARVGACKHCHKLFFARFSHQEFCSQPCRTKDRQSTPEWKDYQRKKAREYYRLHKSGKVK
jgi:hypothetical protein